MFWVFLQLACEHGIDFQTREPLRLINNRLETCYTVSLNLHPNRKSHKISNTNILYKIPKKKKKKEHTSRAIKSNMLSRHQKGAIKSTNQLPHRLKQSYQVSLLKRSIINLKGQKKRYEQITRFNAKYSYFLANGEFFFLNFPLQHNLSVKIFSIIVVISCGKKCRAFCEKK